MPYIKQEQRLQFLPVIGSFIGILSGNDGKISEGGMNYLITYLLHIWINHKGLSYSTLNSAIGILECAKQELYRQVAAPYEDKKKEENDPVSNLDTPLRT